MKGLAYMLCRDKLVLSTLHKSMCQLAKLKPLAQPVVMKHKALMTTTATCRSQLPQWVGCPVQPESHLLT